MQKKISLAFQIKKVMGNRILFCSVIFTILIFFLTIYDLSISIQELRSRITDKIKPIEDFVIDQAIIDNRDTIALKIENFNERNSMLKIEWIQQGSPHHHAITWQFPFSWIYDYGIGKISGFQFGYFKVTGSFLSDKTLIYDLLFRLTLLAIITFSISSILYPLARKIPEQLFLNPINRFIDLISNDISVQDNINTLPTELEILEKKILGLLDTAKEHERNRATIELGHLFARFAHDIGSPLAAMEMSIHLLNKKIPHDQLMTLNNGIESLRDIANNVLERHRNSNTNINLSGVVEPVNEVKLIYPVLIANLVEIIIKQKMLEWYVEPCELRFLPGSTAEHAWIAAAPNEVKRLLSNLLNNSYDALLNKNEGFIQITIDIITDKIYLKLYDNGIGIPDEKINAVLQGVSFKHSGKGLGLSEAKQYMEDLSGKLSIRSVVGKWTEITLIFPLLKNG